MFRFSICFLFLFSGAPTTSNSGGALLLELVGILTNSVKCQLRINDCLFLCAFQAREDLQQTRESLQQLKEKFVNQEESGRKKVIDLEAKLSSYQKANAELEVLRT